MCAGKIYALKQMSKAHIIDNKLVAHVHREKNVSKGAQLGFAGCRRWGTGANLLAMLLGLCRHLRLHYAAVYSLEAYQCRHAVRLHRCVTTTRSRSTCCAVLCFAAVHVGVQQPLAGQLGVNST